MANGRNFSTYEEKRPRTELGPYKESGRGKTCQIRLPDVFRGHIRSYLLEDLVIIPLYTLYITIRGFDNHKDWWNSIKEDTKFIQESDANRLWHFFQTDYWLSIVNNDTKIKELEFE